MLYGFLTPDLVSELQSFKNEVEDNCPACHLSTMLLNDERKGVLMMFTQMLRLSWKEKESSSQPLMQKINLGPSTKIAHPQKVQILVN